MKFSFDALTACFSRTRNPVSLNLPAPFLRLIALSFLLGSAAAIQAAEIAGVVTDAGTGTPITNKEVCASFSDPETGNFLRQCALSGTDGQYSLTGLPDSVIQRVSTRENDTYARQTWPDVSAGEQGSGEEIDLAAGDRTDIDFPLRRGYFITGQVTDTDGALVENVSAGAILVFDGGGWSSFGGSNPEPGVYQSSRVVPGEYKLLVQSFGSMDRTVDELYPNVPCVQFRCNITAEGDLIPIVDADVEIDVVLEQGYRIEGSVTDSAMDPVTDHSVDINIFRASDGNRAARAHLNDSGTYASPALPSGDYKVLFRSNQFIDQFYSDEECGPCDPLSQGEVIALGMADETGIDAQMSEGGEITGSVVSEADDSPIEGRVEILDAAGSFVASTSINSDGMYAVIGLPAGDYKVWFDAQGDSANFIDELHENVNCPDLRCDVANLGSVITVGAGETVSLSAQLEPGAEITGTLTRSDTGEPIESGFQ